MRAHKTRPRYTVDNSTFTVEALVVAQLMKTQKGRGVVPRPFACLGLGNLQQLLLMLTGKCNDPAHYNTRRRRRS
jgi:hypothetical protein